MIPRPCSTASANAPYLKLVDTFRTAAVESAHSWHDRARREAELCGRNSLSADTTSILNDLPATGATQLLCDAGTNIPAFAAACRKTGRAFRANVDARLVHRGPVEAIRRQTAEILQTAGARPGFLLSRVVVAYDCEPSHVLVIREILDQGVDA